jgi:hypothetical protein
MVRDGDSQRTLTDRGYECFVIDEGRRQLVPLAQLPPNHFGDYLAVSPDVRASFLRSFGGAIRARAW